MRLKAMKILFSYLSLLVLIGCTTKAGPFESGSYCQVTNDNVLTYGPAVIKVNPHLEHFKMSERIKVIAGGVLDANVKEEYHIFSDKDFDKGVLIQVRTIREPGAFWQPDDDAYKDVNAFDKGKIEIDNKKYYYGTRYIKNNRFPKSVLAAFKERGIYVTKYAWRLEKGVCRVVTNQKSLCVYYIEGTYDNRLNSSAVQEFADRFNKNITITHQ